MQRKTLWRAAAAVTAAGTVAAAVVLLPSNASAAPGDAQSTAFGLSANVLGGTIFLAPTPTSAYPAGGSTSTVGVTVLASPLVTLGQAGVLTATTAGNTSGNSSATGSAANVALLGTAIPGLAAITADAISASCTASGATATGSTTLTNAHLGATVLNVSPAANTVLLNTALIKIVLNEQITDPISGKLTVNALHIIVVPAGPVGDVIIGQATCGPNTPVAAGDAFSFQNLPLILGGLAIIGMIGFGLRAGTRRLRGLA